jgi:molybdopterin converting factor small subunit
MAILVPHFLLAKLIGKQVIESEAGSVRDLLDEIRTMVGAERWEKVKRAAILVNGRNISRLEGVDTPLGPRDKVWMIVPSAGG